MKKTRNQRKRELMEQILASAILLAVCILVMTLRCGMACKAFVECPAEQPVSYAEHMERFGGANYAIQN